MLIVALSLLVNAPIVRADSVRPAFRAAASAVIDSASAWAPTSVGRASHIIVDRTSFQAAAVQIGAADEDWTGFAGAVRASADDKRLDQARVCTGLANRPSCTLPSGTILVRADSVSRRDGQIALTVSVLWAHGRLMGRAVYEVIMRGGQIISIQQALRS